MEKKLFQVGLIRVLTSDDPHFVDMHGQIIMDHFPGIFAYNMYLLYLIGVELFQLTVIILFISYISSPQPLNVHPVIYHKKPTLYL